MAFLYDTDARAVPQGTGRREGAWVLALACLVGGIRFLRLGYWSLWYDEALTLGDAWHSPGWLQDGSPQHVLGYALIRWTADAFGGRPDEFALRFGPALAGWLCIPLAFWAFRPMAGGRRAALAALLLASSSWHLYWSQNARAYTFAQAGTLVATGVWVRGWLDGKPLRCALGVGIALLSGLLHPHAVLLAAGLGLGPFLARRLPGALRPMRGEGEDEDEEAGAPKSPAEQPSDHAGPPDHAGLGVLLAGTVLAIPLLGPALLNFVHNKTPGDSSGWMRDASANLVHLVASTGFQFTPLLLVAALLGVWVGWRQMAGRVTAIAIVLPVLAVMGVALFARVSVQYLFSVLPWVALAAAWPAGMRRMRRGAGFAYGSLLVLPALASCALYLGPRQGERPRWREAYSYVWSERGAHDLVLGMQAGLGEYYVDPAFTDIRHPKLIGWCDRTRAHNISAAARTNRPLWIVLRPDFLQLWEPAARASFEALLQDQCLLKQRFPVFLEGRDLELLVYYRPGG